MIPELYEQMPASRPFRSRSAGGSCGAGRTEAEELDATIRQNLEVLGYGE